MKICITIVNFSVEYIDIQEYISCLQFDIDSLLLLIYTYIYTYTTLKVICYRRNSSIINASEDIITHYT